MILDGKVTPEAVIVDRNGARTWDMNLRFNCVSCPAEKEEPSRESACSTVLVWKMALPRSSRFTVEGAGAPSEESNSVFFGFIDSAEQL